MTAITSACFTVYPLSNFPCMSLLVASEVSCCLGPGGGYCIATVAEETVNHNLWSYMGNNRNGKFHTSAILGIHQCSFPPYVHCFMAYSIGFIQHFSPRRHCGESCDIAESFSPYLPLFTWLSTAILAMTESLYF